MQESNKKLIKLNLGCAARPLDGFINIDLDSLEEIQQRYPHLEFKEGTKIYNYDIFNLPYAECSVDLIRSDSLFEHLSYLEEKKLFLEVYRVLKPGGILEFSVPDFEDTVKLWLDAEDNWKDFFRDDEEAIKQCHWFGQYSYSTESRWGYLTASIFGPQNSPGQFHKNCYTEGKIRAILSHLSFEIIEISRYRWKEERNLMIQVNAKKL